MRLRRRRRSRLGTRRRWIGTGAITRRPSPRSSPRFSWASTRIPSIRGKSILSFNIQRISSSPLIDCAFVLNSSCISGLNEIDLEYSKKKIIDKINSYFGYSVVKKINLVSFDNTATNFKEENIKNKNVENSKYLDKIIKIKNEKIKKSLTELSKIFKQK